MAEEPQPPTVHEGHDEAKQSAALNQLDRPNGEDGSSGAAKKDVDTKALDAAMQNLDVTKNESADKEATQKALEAEKKRKEEEAKEVARRNKVKVDAGDVTLLVEQLDLTKVKATDLLKHHEGDAVKALTAYVTPVIA